MLIPIAQLTFIQLPYSYLRRQAVFTTSNFLRFWRISITVTLAGNNLKALHLLFCISGKSDLSSVHLGICPQKRVGWLLWLTGEHERKHMPVQSLLAWVHIGVWLNVCFRMGGSICTRVSFYVRIERTASRCSCNCRFSCGCGCIAVPDADAGAAMPLTMPLFKVVVIIMIIIIGRWDLNC